MPFDIRTILPKNLRIDWAKEEAIAHKRILDNFDENWDNFCAMHDLAFTSPTAENDAKRKKFNNEFYRWKMKTDLFFLTKEVLGFKDLSNSLHQAVCDWLWTTRNERRRALIIPRGHYKTTIGTISRAIQHIINDPGVRIPIISGDKKFSVQTSDAIMHKIEESLELQRVFPEIFLPRSMVKNYSPWTKELWSIKRPRLEPRGGYTVDTLSPGSASTGRHYCSAYYDDLTTELNTRNEGQRQAIYDVVDYVGKKLDTPSETSWSKNMETFIGTFYDPRDFLVGQALKGLAGKDYDRVLECGHNAFKGKTPSFFVSNKIFLFATEVTFKGSDNRNVTHFVFPEKFSKEEIAIRKELSVSDTIFAAQYYNDILTTSDTVFPPPYENRYWARTGQKRLPDVLRKVIVADLASDNQSKKTKDETVIAVMGMCASENIWDLETRAKFAMQTDEIVDNIVDLVEIHPEVELIGIEAVGGFWLAASMLFDEIKKRVPASRNLFPVKLPQSRNKLDHCSFINKWWKNDQFHIRPGNRQLLEEMRMFSGSRKGKDDYVDTAAHGCRQLEILGPPESKHVEAANKPWYSEWQEKEEEKRNTAVENSIYHKTKDGSLRADLPYMSFYDEDDRYF